MKYCEQCGKPLSENAKFCPACGTPVAADEPAKQLICEKCGEPLEDDAEFCPACGAKRSKPRQSADRSFKPERPVRTSAVSDSASKELRQYLERIVSLEKSIYAQTQTIDTIWSRINDLGHAKRYTSPTHPGYRDLSGEDYKDCFYTAPGCGAVIGAFIGLFVGHFFGGIIVGAIVLAVLCFALKLMDCSSVDKENDRQYELDLQAYRNAVSQDKLRVEKETKEKENLTTIVQTMEQQRDETANVLEQFYSANVVFPKYRNMIAMCTIYEYFAAGRCDSLTGHEGAYNIFESEVRLERICTRLDEVIQNLEQIRENQYILYDAIQEGNQVSRQLLTESVKQSQLAEQTTENTALAAHYSEVAANNAEACAWIGAANYLEQHNS